MKTVTMNISSEVMHSFMTRWRGKTYFRTWGILGDTCSKCSKTANVMPNCGWFCPCGAFNVLPWSPGMMMPHEKPDYGPTRSEIRAALDSYPEKNEQ